MKKKKRLVIKDQILKKIIKGDARKGAKKDFFELLKRAVSS
jgi:hypothetical protein